ncbi:PH and SEC7 domain-containing protein-like [Paramacrobiotus metropolitanus]|uniref:PH and SEC7 domain-containing protein-like n=1 Tax=Paramacrobiotus metropolitanus TaxID=2943436 RepID=UPI00244622A3|nr:PH and SEC7 domain-containing protein-like [Paramacrobiotus metropolitanus]
MTSVESPQSLSLSEPRSGDGSGLKTSPPRFEAYIMTGNVMLSKTNVAQAPPPGKKSKGAGGGGRIYGSNNVVLRSPVQARRSPGGGDKENEEDGEMKGEYVQNVFECSGQDVHGFTLNTVVCEKDGASPEVAVESAVLDGVDVRDSASSATPPPPTPPQTLSSSPEALIRVPTPSQRAVTPESLDDRPVWTINAPVAKGAVVTSIPASPRRLGRGYREILKEETIITDTTISEVTDTQIQSTFIQPSPRTPRHGGERRLVERTIDIDVVDSPPIAEPAPAADDNIPVETNDEFVDESVQIEVPVDADDVQLQPSMMQSEDVPPAVDAQGNFVHPESARACMEVFPLDGMGIDQALRVFLSQVKLTGETQARQRVVDLFAMRYVECNPEAVYNRDSANAVVSGMLILNSDLHSEHRPAQSMNCSRFLANIRQLPVCRDVPDDELQRLYYAMKTSRCLCRPAPISRHPRNGHTAAEAAPVIAYEGLLYRKSCYEPGGKATRFGKRGWSKFYVVINDLSLEFFKKQGAESPVLRVPLHHGYALPATDYRKRRNVLRLYGVDQSVCLLQAANEPELQRWLDAVNRTAAVFSAPVALPVGSQTLAHHTRRMSTMRPLYPTGKSLLSVDEQIEELRKCDERLLREVEALNVRQPESSSEAIAMSEQLTHYQRELQRNKIYQDILLSMT